MADQQSSYSVPQFAGIIRNKFPGSYDSIPDDQLVSAWVEKYPVYRSQVGLPPTTPVGMVSQNRGYRITAAQDAQAKEIASKPWWDRPLVSSDTLARAFTGFNSTAEMHDIVQNPTSYPEYASDTTKASHLALLGMAADATDTASSMTNPLSLAVNFLHIPLGAASKRVATAGEQVENAIKVQQGMRAAGATEPELRQAAQSVLDNSRRYQSAQNIYSKVRGATTASNVALAAQGVPGAIQHGSDVFNSDKTFEEKLNAATAFGQDITNMGIAALSARQVSRSTPAPPSPERTGLTPAQAARIEQVRQRTAGVGVGPETQPPEANEPGGMIDASKQAGRNLQVPAKLPNQPGTFSVPPTRTYTDAAGVTHYPSQIHRPSPPPEEPGGAVPTEPTGGPKPPAPDTHGYSETDFIADLRKQGMEPTKEILDRFREGKQQPPQQATTPSAPFNATAQPQEDKEKPRPSDPADTQFGIAKHFEQLKDQQRRPDETLQEWHDRTYGYTEGGEEAKPPDEFTTNLRDQLLATRGLQHVEPKEFDKETSSDFDQQFLNILQGPGATSKPSEPTPSAKGSPTDLSQLTPTQRHEWINKNVHFKIEGATSPADARAKLGQMIEQNLAPKQGLSEIVSYIDKDGKTQFGVRYTARPAPAATTLSDRPTEEPSPYAAKVQELEGKFNSLTRDQHKQVLADLQSTVAKALPADSPSETKLALYHKALTKLVEAARSGKGMSAYADAFNIAAKKGEGGFLNPYGRRGVTDEQSRRFAALHADTMLSKWERQGTPPLRKMLDPLFRSAVYGANDPELEVRYEALLHGKTTDTVDALVSAIDGVSRSQIARGSLRQNLAAAADSHEVRLKKLDSYMRSWNTRTLPESIGFIDSIERGDLSGIVDPIDRQHAGELRRLLDAKRDEIRDLGTGKLDNFYENYFPHIWKFGPTDLARQVIQGRRPFQGPGSFLKPRTYDTFAEGIAAGMEPVTYNPVQLAMLKLHEMDRYLMAHRSFNELKAYGLVQKFNQRNVPDGWVALNDNMFRAGVDDGNAVKYYAPADVATPLNNHLSPGLRGNVLYNTVSAYNNLSNQFNLGFSAFHAIETGVNSMLSSQALGLQKLSRGKLSGALDIALSPTAPFRNYLLGTKLMQEVMEPGRYAEMAQLHDALQQAGGRIHMDAQFKNAAREGFRNSWLEFQNDPGLKGAGKLAYRGIGAGLEAMAAPLMENFVPRMKLGAFADGAQDIIDRLGPNASPLKLRDEFGKLWDSIDNRFGQVVYDNLFWNRAAKDVAHLTIRSVGWNMGTVRELGGGVLDVKDLKSEGLSTRTAYVLSLMTSTALIGTVISHMYGQKVDGLEDMLYPRTGKIGPDGRPERVFLKTYIHDAWSFGHDPIGTTSNKLAPVWHQIWDLARNSDYYGNQIHPIQPTTLDTLTSADTYKGVASYLAGSEKPFSLGNYSQRRASGESPASALSSTMAVLPAPKWVGQTKAQSLAYELYKTTLQAGPHDPAVVARIQRYHQLAVGYTSGQFTEKDIDKALDAHEITPKQYDGILSTDATGRSDGEMSSLERHVKGLNPQDFLRVFDLSSKQERTALVERFYQKWDKAVEDGDEDLSKKFEQREKLLPKQ